MTAAEIIKWLEEHEGVAPVSDDRGNWNVSSMGFQNVPEDPPEDIEITFVILKDDWKPSIAESVEWAAREWGREDEP